ncbi:hypothetical protein SAMN04487910_2005 [Aquimarina amphilecti]|uniref:YhhN-like protein n=1 Tax=Aquimarina amphilecti TaxID=1038014 RepID=A0A1H7N9Q1_AQUAM|nr:hypothetical protein SAMN04487910_2005 [Aquimarina amphilecti]
MFFCGLFFGNQELIYVKPISSFTLIWIYYENRKRVSFLYPLIIIIIMINDVLVLKDFDLFFEYISILLLLYYFLCSYLLLPFISLKNIRYKEVLSPSVVIGLLLVVYLAISIFNMTMPGFQDSIGNGVIIVVSLFYFLGCCFIIYLRNHYQYSYYLLIAASSCILVNALVPVQELYYNNVVFEAIIYSVDIIAMLFYLKFLIRTKPMEETKGSNFI